jgi:OmpA-OmpF porin, OOP family
LLNSKDVQIVTNNEVSEIYFPLGSDKELKSEKLDQFLADIAMKAENRKIRLIGHTDNSGEESTNIQLSLNRCNSIKAILLSMGALEQNIACEGKGSSLPKIDNSTPENRAINRRVELKFE